MSKISDEILKQIKAEIEARGVNPSSMDELNKIAGEVMNKQNNKAISDFQGLSPTQMHLLNSHPPAGPTFSVNLSGLSVSLKPRGN